MSSPPHQRRGRWLAGSLGALLAIATPALAGTPQVLRVGVVDGSQPCSYRESGVWRGIAIDLWTRIATQEQLPFQLSEWPSIRALLEATLRGDLDVAVGCINVSPDRVLRYRFTLPFQEDGLAVMVRNSRLDIGRAFVGSLFGPELLQLLGGFLLGITALTLLTWRVENYGQEQDKTRQGTLRRFSKLFQVLATGPGGNTIVHTTRGNGIVIVAYLFRIVTASLLVGYLTVNVVRETQERAAGRINSLKDLRGLRVGVRPGSVSESLITELNRAGQGPLATIVLLSRIATAPQLLREGSIDAVVADNLQLTHLLTASRSKGFYPTLALQGIRPESQAFALSPALPKSTGERINLAISVLKRSGMIEVLRGEATAGADQRAHGGLAK